MQTNALCAFGLSEKEHGADIYSSEMKLYPQGDGTYLANGSKYYIGNGNVASTVSVFGKIADSNEYVFFVVDSPSKYECVKMSLMREMYIRIWSPSYPSPMRISLQGSQWMTCSIR
jgi:acyl-CoA dehydrogenase